MKSPMIVIYTQNLENNKFLIFLKIICLSM